MPFSSSLPFCPHLCFCIERSRCIIAGDRRLFLSKHAPPKHSQVTNNFAEIKSTVFKRYEEKSLFPIITSDIVERFYLLLDIIFVLARLKLGSVSNVLQPQ